MHAPEATPSEAPLSRWLGIARSAVWPALVPGALLFAYMQSVGYLELDMIGIDAHAYWVAARHPETWYTLSVGERAPDGFRQAAYLYSPAFAQALWPLGNLPWPVFQALWLAGQCAALAWLLKPLGWARALVLAAFFLPEFLLGNLYFFYAAALVAAVTIPAPAALAFPLLTKITPGVVGLWFLLRRQWGAAVRAAAVTLAITGLSVLANPNAWVRWGGLLVASGADGGPGVYARMLVGVALVVGASLTGRAWLLAPAMLLACPNLGGLSPLALLAAIPRLAAYDRLAAPRRQLTAATS